MFASFYTVYPLANFYLLTFILGSKVIYALPLLCFIILCLSIYLPLLVGFMLSHDFPLLFAMFSFQFKNLVKHLLQGSYNDDQILQFLLSWEDYLIFFFKKNFAGYSILDFQIFFHLIL